MKLKFPQPDGADERPLNCSAQEAPAADSDAVRTDNELVRRAQEGDIAAFEGLFKRHRKRVYNIALRILNDESEAADATQEVFVRVFRSISKLVSEEAFTTWLKTMTVNICRDFLRKRGSVRFQSLDATVETDDGRQLTNEIADWSNNPERSLDEKQTRELVRKAIASLSSDHREVVTLFYVDEADVAEIAKILGCADGTVKSRLARARAELKRKLECFVMG